MNNSLVYFDLRNLLDIIYSLTIKDPEGSKFMCLYCISIRFREYITGFLRLCLV